MSTKYICQNCNIEFISNAKKIRKFCSRKCANRYNQQKDLTKKSTFICQWCHKEFTEYSYRHPTFCSRLCMSKYAARQPKIRARRPENFITLKCEICYKEFKVHKTQLSKEYPTKYCSYDCLSIANSRRMKGNGNPNYIDGTSPQNYGEDWYKQSRKAKKRDKNTCQICGLKHNRKLGIIVDAHHKIPLRKFSGNWEEANKLSNIISLCRKCHRIEEMKYRNNEIKNSLDLAH